MWIDKNGTRVATGTGQVPRNINRTNLYVARSNWTNDTPLIGTVTTLTIDNVR